MDTLGVKDPSVGSSERFEGNIHGLTFKDQSSRSREAARECVENCIQYKDRQTFLAEVLVAPAQLILRPAKPRDSLTKYSGVKKSAGEPQGRHHLAARS